MPHTVWNLGRQQASARVQPRQFVAGIEPAQGVVIGRSREPKTMLVILDAWIEVVDVVLATGTADLHFGKYSLALGKDPLNDALLLPIAELSYGIFDAGVGNTDQPVNGGSYLLRDIFKAQGTMWAVKQIAIDVQEQGVMDIDADVHMDWDVAFVDWWTWFKGWNDLEAAPDGSLVDGERAYA